MEVTFGSQRGLGRSGTDSLTAAPLLISVELTAGGPVVALAGELDVATASLAQAVCLDACEAHSRSSIVVDLTRLSFCDCAGLNMLLHVHKRALMGNGWLRLSGASARVRKVLAITGLASTLMCYSMPADAFADVGPSTPP